MIPHLQDLVSVHITRLEKYRDDSKMRMMLNHLEDLKEELDGIEETEEELHTIQEHVLALENILKSAKKPECYLFFAS